MKYIPFVGEFFLATGLNPKIPHGTLTQYLGIYHNLDIGVGPMDVMQFAWPRRTETMTSIFNLARTDMDLMFIRVNLGDYEKPITTPIFWDCNCETDYIKTCHIGTCEKCGAFKDDCPDSIAQEVYQYGFNPVTGQRLDFSIIEDTKSESKQSKISNVWSSI